MDGAEQIVSALDRALVAAGHRSLVVACGGSTVAGERMATPHLAGVYAAEVKREAQARHRRAIAAALERDPVDVVHLHGVDFDQ